MKNTDKIFWFTVGDVIKILKEYPENMPVIISGQDNGYENFFLPEELRVVHVPDNYYRDGEFQVADGNMNSDNIILHNPPIPPKPP